MSSKVVIAYDKVFETGPLAGLSVPVLITYPNNEHAAEIFDGLVYDQNFNAARRDLITGNRYAVAMVRRHFVD